jgi:hypothetical protein
MNIDKNFENIASNFTMEMNIENEKKKSNFSTTTSSSSSSSSGSTNGSILRGGNSANVKGDIKKLVIKNFKSKVFYSHINSAL